MAYLHETTWWKGRRRERISGENLGKRKAEKPRTHWQPNRRAARRPTWICGVQVQVCRCNQSSSQGVS